MPTLTLEQAKKYLEDARTSLGLSLQGKAYEISTGNSSRAITRQSPKAILEIIKYWENKVKILERGSSADFRPTGVREENQNGNFNTGIENTRGIR